MQEHLFSYENHVYDKKFHQGSVKLKLFAFQSQMSIF